MIRNCLLDAARFTVNCFCVAFIPGEFMPARVRDNVNVGSPFLRRVHGGLTIRAAGICAQMRTLIVLLQEY
jgi:hypothetical protein